MSNILRIDTSDNKRVKIEIEKKGKTKKFEEDARKLRSQTILILISNALRDQSLDFKDLNSVEVKTGPGSFTGLRVGISIANALSYLLKIPVNNKNLGEIEMPVYN